MIEKTLYFSNPRVLAALYCARPDNLGRIEQALAVRLVSREEWIQIAGEAESVARAEALFHLLDQARTQGLSIRQGDFETFLRTAVDDATGEMTQLFAQPLVLQFKRTSVVPKTIGQKRYLMAMRDHEVVFGLGPAGTGKTYLAVACAVDALLNDRVSKLILARPAVEAGEALGFLPGDLQEKIKPYLRPLYDALHDLLGQETTGKLMERGVIEIAPLAYMRGRTLADAFIILDEAQNTTPEQMMMFLTRLGERSRMVITGDLTQIDLPRRSRSGLRDAVDILGRVPGLAFHHFRGADVVRHPLVQRIIEAYEARARAEVGQP